VRLDEVGWVGSSLSQEIVVTTTIIAMKSLIMYLSLFTAQIYKKEATCRNLNGGMCSIKRKNK
jgi:hypothetical protein